MRAPFLAAFAVACAAATLAAQTSQTQPPAASGKKPPKSITLTGCVAADDTAPEHPLTLVDTRKRRSYRLTGVDMRAYVGQQVQVWGGFTVKGVHIGTGLAPSANVAAQAGAMDPAQAAMATAPGGAATGTGTITLPEFLVKTVKTLQNPCPPK